MNVRGCLVLFSPYIPERERLILDPATFRIFPSYQYQQPFLCTSGPIRLLHTYLYGHKISKVSTKILILKMSKGSQERPRMQDFAPFTPELLGALSGPQTPGRKATSLREVGRVTSDPLLNFSAFFLLGQNHA